MSVFLGIGLGPIQTGIFLKSACEHRVKRIVIAETDPVIVEVVRREKYVTINIAGDQITQLRLGPLEIYNPRVPEDLAALTNIASEADEVAVALPGVGF